VRFVFFPAHSLVTLLLSRLGMAVSKTPPHSRSAIQSKGSWRTRPCTEQVTWSPLFKGTAFSASTSQNQQMLIEHLSHKYVPQHLISCIFYHTKYFQSLPTRISSLADNWLLSLARCKILKWYFVSFTTRNTWLCWLVPSVSVVVGLAFNIQADNVFSSRAKAGSGRVGRKPVDHKMWSRGVKPLPL